MEKPQISVIVPIYNMGSTLQTALGSLSNQTYENYEVILVDDGSTDKSNSICQQFIMSHPRFHLYTKKNGGVSDARNYGLSKSKGEWITFFDADDIVKENWLKDFEVDENHNYDIICQGICADKPIVGPDSRLKELGFNFKGNIPNLISELNRTGLLGYAFIKCFRREIIDRFNIRFDTKVHFQEDELFVVEYLKNANRGVCMNSKNYFYYVPDWSKYQVKDLEKSIYRVEKVLYLLLDIFKEKKSDIIIGKTDRLNLLIMEALLKKISISNFNKLRNLYRKGLGYSKLPMALQKKMGYDKTYLTFMILLSLYRIKRLITTPNYI